MSSKFIPPSVGLISLTVLIIVSTSFESIHIGIASMSANSLNNMHFPSITGIEALAPISPRPKTALPSVTTAIVFPFEVYL